jgi:DNA (cytosine-5)-methyltransferase 1
MKNPFKADKEEVTEILKSLYDGLADYDADAAKMADNLIKDIAMPLDDQFLTERGAALKEMFDTDVSLKIRLAQMYEDYRMNENGWLDNPLRNYCNYYIQDRQEHYNHDAPKLIDLFCGAGGLSLGFTQCGFITSLANDIQECCIDTYSHNHPETPRKNIILGDINSIIPDLESHLRFKDVDVIIGGPPCQGFSMANRQRLIDDPRNHLYKSYVKVVSLVKPKFFIMENVKGMLPVARQVIEDFNGIGYDVQCQVLRAEDFGVPQHRERLIFIGNRLGIDNRQIFDDIGKISNGATRTVLRDALVGLRPLQASRVKNATEKGSIESGSKIERNNAKTTNAYVSLINQNRAMPLVFNHKARYNNDRDIEIFSRLNPGDRSDDPKIADIMPYARRNNIFKDKYFKLEPDKVCKTITAHMKFDCNMYIHPSQARGLTPREAARVQSYPDDYFFRGAYTKTYMQIGNSVPPLMGRAIAMVIRKYLGK